MSVQHANRGIVKKDLQLYYNREFVKSFRGEATINTCDLNSRVDYVWANGVKTRDTTAPSPPPITGFEIAKLRSTDGLDTQTILYTAAVDQVNGGVYTHSAYIYLESGTWVSVGQHWNPWNYGVQTYIPLNKWTRVSFTVTNSAANYGQVACSYNTDGVIYITATQYEKKSYSTPFVNGSRTANTIAGGGGLLDISGNNVNVDLTNVSFDSTGYIFNGSSNYIDLGSDVIFKTSGGWSVSSWFNLTQVNSGNLYNFIGASAITYNSWYWTVYQSKLALYNQSPGAWYYGSTTILANTWYNAVLVCSYDGTRYQMYLNGIAEGGTHATYTWNADYSGLKIGYVGRGDASNGRYFYGKYPNFQVYNKELTAAEVLQNFNATRKTYGI